MLLQNESTAPDLASEYYRSVWKLHGVLTLRMTTDRGSEIFNKFSAALGELIGTMHSRTTAYHSQSDGQTEQMNRVLEDMLRHYVPPKQDNWDDLLPAAEFAIKQCIPGEHSGHAIVPQQWQAPQAAKQSGFGLETQDKPCYLSS